VVISNTAGYGGGLWRKEYLLALEQAQAFHLT
jgi:O6-methylguanine-DNA--protein-cysteine methyltransferase